jgi:4-alpha-glucanotransferase
MLSKRASGILMHPTSLPSPGGIGDFGPAAYRFVDWLAAAKQTLWQILPLGPVGFGNSPYSCTSAFAGNVLMISLERLADRELIDRNKLGSLTDGEMPVDFDSVRAHKLPLLRQAANNFLKFAGSIGRGRFEQFCRDAESWLEDYVLYSVLREHFGNRAWNEWPDEIAHRDPKSIAKLRNELHDQIDQERFLQFAFFEQWRAVHSYCSTRGIRIIGDVAIFVSYDSADVWTHPDLFRLKKDLSPVVVAGVPPDAFSKTGQRWGNPVYDWDALKARGYNWWIQRMRWAVKTCDILRLDHFRGFEAYWEIPADEPTAVHGHWVKGPNTDLFETMRTALGDLPFIAEDLGYITPEVRQLRKELDIPGMKVLQFGFGDRGAHIYLPHRFQADSVVYTGTHDNDTTVGWWNSCATKEEKKLATLYLGIYEGDVHWAFIRAALTSVAVLSIVPVQDILGLGSDCRMNIPSKVEGNWSWRLPHQALTPKLAKKLSLLVQATDRDTCVINPSDHAQQGDGKMPENFAA